jgi:hypothetical protein
MAGSLSGNYSGTINSSASPSPIAVSVTASLTEAQNYSLAGSASLTNSTCFTSLNFGQGSMAIGGALYLVDSAHGVQIGALPTGNGAFTVAYQINSGACNGDFGSGTITKQ